jgi:hypothetical protein
VGVSVIACNFSAAVQSGFEAAGIDFGMVGYSPPALFPRKDFFIGLICAHSAFCEELAIPQVSARYLRRFEMDLRCWSPLWCLR